MPSALECYTPLGNCACTPTRSLNGVVDIAAVKGRNGKGWIAGKFNTDYVYVVPPTLVVAWSMALVLWRHIIVEQVGLLVSILFADLPSLHLPSFEMLFFVILRMYQQRWYIVYLKDTFINGY